MEVLIPSLDAPTDDLALRVGDQSLDQRSLFAACAHHVQMLQTWGVSPGDRVGVWTQPSLETLVAFIAHAAAGYVSVPIDPKLGDTELGHVLRNAAPRVTLAADADAVRAKAADIDTFAIQLGAASSLPRAPVDDSPALVLYTSGTTGAPKGAVITRRNIAANLDMLARAWAWTSSDIVVHALPMFHVHGLVLGLFGSQRRGGALHWVPRFTPHDLTHAIAEHGSRSILFAVPTMYHRLCEAAPTDPSIGDALRRARLLVSGSAPLSVREHTTIEQLTGQRVIERYGLTETLINCSTRHDGDRRAGVVGPPLDGVELRLVDDERRPLAASADPSSIGEVVVRGPHVFAGYLDNPAATADVLDEQGWFHTGDLAMRHADGAIQIVGRRSTDLIKCGGYKVGAGEVEAALLDHPAVAEAAVIGAPDDDLGERIVAFVVLRPSIGHLQPSDIASHVAAQLSPHKRPRDVRVVDALPRNAMGKVQKTKLRALL
jgi:malonyl-CoA/methylmalonyl-CoA synthetase